MEKPKVRVAVNGYGVIGKRVADAVAAQDDMALVGISDIDTDYRVRVAAERGYPIFASDPKKIRAMEEAGISPAGDINALLSQADIVVDCAPKKLGAQNRALYEKAGVRAIFQGGEKHEVAGFSFVAQVNYEAALDLQTARVVSCNTTALCRVLNALHRRGWVKRARAVILRRGTDPWESHKTGMINTVIPETKVPSHQGPDALTVIPGLDLTTMAGAGPFNLAHIHFAMVETTRPVALDELRHALWEEPRIAFVRAGHGLVALNGVVELMRDLGRPRGDMWEVAVWEDSLATDGREVYLTYQVDNEAITIPESVDAIRALTGIERQAGRSIAKTNESLGIMKTFLPRTVHEHEAHLRMSQSSQHFMEEGYKGSEEPTDEERPKPD